MHHPWLALPPLVSLAPNCHLFILCLDTFRPAPSSQGPGHCSWQRSPKWSACPAPRPQPLSPSLPSPCSVSTGVLRANLSFFPPTSARSGPSVTTMLSVATLLASTGAGGLALAARPGSRARPSAVTHLCSHTRSSFPGMPSSPSLVDQNWSFPPFLQACPLNLCSPGTVSRS